MRISCGGGGSPGLQGESCWDLFSHCPPGYHKIKRPVAWPSPEIKLHQSVVGNLIERLKPIAVNLPDYFHGVRFPCGTRVHRDQIRGDCVGKSRRDALGGAGVPGLDKDGEPFRRLVRFWGYPFV